MVEASVFVFDDLHPEDNAMTQALYSRSPDSVLAHREKVSTVGSGKFMDTYYIGYGHPSIGDCGDTTIYIENVSMLVAKAIQDSPLYSGQEASTRYLNFSSQPQYDPYNHVKSQAILDRWLALYNQYMPLVIKGLKRHHPFNPATDKNEQVWEKTIKVRAFDTLRSLLPIATTTLLSWHTNLRQARDHLRHLISHPLLEVRQIAHRIYDALVVKYPNSFNEDDVSVDSERYRDRNVYAQNIDNYYLRPEKIIGDLTKEEIDDFLDNLVIFDTSWVNIRKINADKAALKRPRGSLIPRRMIQYGMYDALFLLDFGSFRDIQRHRNGYCPIPLVTDAFGFHTWYDNELARVLSFSEYIDLRNAIDEQLEDIRTLSIEGVTVDILQNQYLYPMGIACGCQTSYSFPQIVYVAELRSNKTVHSSLRPIAQSFGKELEFCHPDLDLYMDYDEDSFTTKRGEQDILAK